MVFVGPAPLDEQRILDAGAAVVRRDGPDGMRLVNVARELGVSHAALYRWFPSRLALIEEVARSWMVRRTVELDAIAADAERSADDVLREWMRARLAISRGAWKDDRCLFLSFGALSGDSAVVREHLAHMIESMAAIIERGIADGEFRPVDAIATARVFDAATVRFHHPALAPSWDAPDSERICADLVDFLVDGLRAGG